MENILLGQSTMEEAYNRIKELEEEHRINELEEENRKLKEENELLKECNIRNYTSRSNTDDWNLKLLEENKKLKSELDRYKDMWDSGEF